MPATSFSISIAAVRAIFDGNRHLDHASENTRTTLGEALLEGTTGTITLSGNGALHLRSFGQTETRTLLETRDWRGFAGDCVFALQRHVVDGLMGSGPFENTAADYLRVIEVEEAIYRSANEGRKQGVYECPWKQNQSLRVFGQWMH